MGTHYRRASDHLGLVGTSTYLTIPTSPATLITLGSGYQALEIFVVGTGSIFWGDSNIAINSGNYLWAGMGKQWLGLEDGWSVYLRADSIQSIISLSQYKV